MGTIAEKLNYLNTTKVNIKNAIVAKGVSVSDSDTFRSYASKIADIEPTLGTKTITANGTYTASDDSLQGYSSVTVDIDDTDLYRDTTDSTYESVKTLSNCGAFPMLSLTAEINAVQDLHGYDKPWAGGAGYNKCPEEWIVFSTTSLRTSNFDVNPETEYYFCSPVASQIYYRDADGNDISGITNPQVIGSNRTFTTPSGCYKILLVLSNYGTTYNYDVAVNYPSSITTYSPYSNICPISGWSAVDVTVSPLNISQIYNGQIYGDGTWVSSNMRLTNVAETQDNSYFLKAGTYTLDYDKLNSNAPNLLQCSVLTKDDDYTIIDNFANEWNSVPFTFTLTQDGYLYFTIRKDADTNVNPSDYRTKILGHTTTIQFKDGDNPLTVYGGSLDVVSGVLTVDRAMVDLGSCAWDVRSESVIRCIVSAEANFESQYKAVNGICSAYIIVAQNSLGDGKLSFNNSTQIYLQDNNHTFSTQSDAQQYLNGQKLVYELATPQTYQLTPTQVNSLMGVNNIWANSGDVGDVRYFKKVEL